MQHLFHNLAPIKTEQQRLPDTLILEERQGGVSLIQEDHGVSRHGRGVQVQRRCIAHRRQLIGRHLVESLDLASPISRQHRRIIGIELEIDLRDVRLLAIIAGERGEQDMLRLPGFTAAKLFHLERSAADRFAVERQGWQIGRFHFA